MKHRVDQALVDRGLAESRSRAQALIMAGLVFAGERKVAKAGETIPRSKCAARTIPGSAAAG
jgi:23S rRNA (cytidine1920-2'-O)/16S rRNA (cytidine1409-2'-O)-methyltransferase